MLLSFSHDDMRPMIVNGLRQLAGEPIGRGWVKRQTIREFGPMNQKLFGDKLHLSDLTLHLWWKSRTPARFKFGEVTGRGTRIEISNRLGPHSGRSWVVVEDQGKANLWTLGMPSMEDFALADGFNSEDDFREYFVPEPGDVFDGVLFQW